MKKIIGFVLFLLCYNMMFAYISPNKRSKAKAGNSINFRADCVEGKAITVQSINNVRATLLSSGDVWWDLDVGQYYVPNTPPEIQDISSIFAGAVWIGGYEPIEGGNDLLKIAATTYRSNGGDFYPGPLNDETGTTEQETCEQWDQFFRVTSVDIRTHIINFNKNSMAGTEYSLDSIPDNVRFWPGVGNADFITEYGFQLPDAGQGLASFYDHPDSQLDIYDPENGDYPKIEVRGCPDPQYPDEMFFWIYNDQGGPHLGTKGGSAIQMEVQVQAFGYQSNDELNDMTFQRYKLINRAQTVIKDCYFAMWVDGDLGCDSDDYIGCDIDRSLAILYNQDEVDGSDGCTCTSGAPTYCSDVPILGVDYFRGPLKPIKYGVDSVIIDIEDDEDPEGYVELGMSSFIYTNRGNAGNHPPGTWDPENALEHYNLLDGKWRDDLPVTFGGSGYNTTSNDTVRYVLPSPPSDASGWSMCSADLGEGDRRTIQASGPFVLKQGAVNELIIGVVWVPDQVYPCPELGALNKADDLAQALFDNCFETLDGPDGPDVDIIELDREVIMLLTNDTILSNNKFEEYVEFDIFATDSIAKGLPEEDKEYSFEGYIIYQLRDFASTSSLDDIDRARIVRQVDLKNGVTTIYNWDAQINPLPGNNEKVFTPVKKTVGTDNGIAHSFSITEDAFDQGDSRLVNHRKYYFYVIAYGHNDYAVFNPKDGFGQQRPFLSGRRNFGVIEVVPRPMVYDALNSFYGDGPRVTRLQGVGNQGQFMLMADEMYDKILANDGEENVVYKDGSSPIRVKIVNPLDVKDGKFRLEVQGDFDDFDDKNGHLLNTDNSKWILEDLETGKVYSSLRNLEQINERIIRDYGFSLTISREEDPSNKPTVDVNAGGFVGASLDYKDGFENKWLTFLPSGGFPDFEFNAFNFITKADADKFDPTGKFSLSDGVNMIPFKLADAGTPPLITPALRNDASTAASVQGSLKMGDLNNVDIVFTNDKSKWSKCIVVETSHVDFYDVGYQPEGESEQLNVRDVSSVSKDADSEGNAKNADDNTTGYGWFPGYAVDVETGERLNIFFGENSSYGGEFENEVGGNFGRDMMWNPDSRIQIPTPEGKVASIWNLYTGGQHTIYVTRTKYDECKLLREYLDKDASKSKLLKSLKWITWTGIPMVRSGEELLSYGDGLIPNEAIVKLRVDNVFGEKIDFVDEKFVVKSGNPVYEIEIRGKQATEVDATTIDEALTNVNAVPNPYYGSSTYELSQNDARVKITNVPSKCTITIYSLDGRFITQFKRDARRTAIKRASAATAAVNFRQEEASVVWNLKNSSGIPVSSGVYLIHVVDVETGSQKTIKWFGVNRKFDPSGL